MISLFCRSIRIYIKIFSRLKHRQCVDDTVSWYTKAMMAGNYSLSTVSLANETSRQEMIRYKTYLRYSLTFVQSFISLAGLLGNLLALIIINKKSMRNTSSAVFITYMAIFDSAVLLLHASVLVQDLVHPRRSFVVRCSSYFMTDYFTLCANWILVIITLGKTPPAEE